MLLLTGTLETRTTEEDEIPWRGRTARNGDPHARSIGLRAHRWRRAELLMSISSDLGSQLDMQSILCSWSCAPQNCSGPTMAESSAGCPAVATGPRRLSTSRPSSASSSNTRLTCRSSRRPSIDETSCGLRTCSTTRAPPRFATRWFAKASPQSLLHRSFRMASHWVRWRSPTTTGTSGARQTSSCCKGWQAKLDHGS